MIPTTPLVLLCLVGTLAGGVALWNGVRALIRASTAGTIAELPVSLEQPVFLTETGIVVLAIRTGALRTGFGGVSYTLRHAGSGVPVPGRPVLMRMRRTDLHGVVTLGVHRFEVPQPGEYLLVARGLMTDRDYAEARLVLERPRGPAVLLRILQVIAAAGATIVSIVFGALALLGRLDGS
jgi:hypothetical protein